MGHRPRYRDDDRDQKGLVKRSSVRARVRAPICVADGVRNRRGGVLVE